MNSDSEVEIALITSFVSLEPKSRMMGTYHACVAVQKCLTGSQDGWTPQPTPCPAMCV